MLQIVKIFSQSVVRKKLNPEDRVVAISYEKMTKELEQLPAHGMDPLKGHDLFKKWRPLIPEEHREETCLYPGDDIMALIKVNRTNKHHTKEAKKRNNQIKNTKTQEFING